MPGEHEGQSYRPQDFVISKIDNRLYGAFIEHMGRAVTASTSPAAAGRRYGISQDVMAFVRNPLPIPVIRYPGGNFV